MEKEIQLSKLTVIDTGEPGAEVSISLPNYEFKFEDEDAEGVKKLHQIMISPTIKEELGEAIIWEHYFEEGIFRKKTSEFWIITNYRVMCGNYKTDVFVQIPLKYLDVVVMNLHGVFQSQGIAYGGAIPGGLALGVGVMQRSGKSIRIGDLVFIVGGQILLEFNKVFDPNGVNKLVNQVKKQMFGKITLTSMKKV